MIYVVIDFGIGLLDVADENTIAERFKEGLDRWEYLVVIHELDEIDI